MYTAAPGSSASVTRNCCSLLFPWDIQTTKISYFNPIVTIKTKGKKKKNKTQQVVEAEAIYKGEHSFFEEVMILLSYEKLYKMPQVALCKQTHLAPQNGSELKIHTTAVQRED